MMTKIEKRIVIEKSSERIFTYVAEPNASPQVWPGLLEVREVQRARWPGVRALAIQADGAADRGMDHCREV